MRFEHDSNVKDKPAAATIDAMSVSSESDRSVILFDSANSGSCGFNDVSIRGW
jgi:hypothetical protein